MRRFSGPVGMSHNRAFVGIRQKATGQACASPVQVHIAGDLCEPGRSQHETVPAKDQTPTGTVSETA